MRGMRIALPGADARLACAQRTAIAATLSGTGDLRAVGALPQDLAGGGTVAMAVEPRFCTPYASFLAGLEPATAH